MTAALYLLGSACFAAGTIAGLFAPLAVSHIPAVFYLLGSAAFAAGTLHNLRHSH